MRKVLVACALVLSACGQQAQPASTLPGVESPVPSLNKTLIEQAKKDGHQTVPLMISVKAGQSDLVEQGLLKLGATVEARDPKIGYLRAEVPVDRVAEVPALPGVSKVDFDEPLSNRDPEP